MRRLTSAATNGFESAMASGRLHVFVADFGVGQLTSEALLREGARLGFTRTVSDLLSDSFSGSMLYVAPEVLEGQAATARSDIYSLGVVLWQLLIGNLRAAVDAADWSARIPDPLLREDLARCLAGSPGKRWSSAGELASRLRSLPERRAAAARLQVDLAAREQAAYRRGVVRMAGVTAGLVALFATLASLAWIQSHRARRAHGEVAVKQAAGLKQTDFTSGRRSRGMQLLEIAAATVPDRASVRTAAAAVLGLPDLVRTSDEERGAWSVERGASNVERDSVSGTVYAPDTPTLHGHGPTSLVTDPAVPPSREKLAER